MNKRTKRNLRNFRLFVVKNILNSRYIVRNLTIAVSFMAVVVIAMGGVIFLGNRTEQTEELVVVEERERITASELTNLNPVSIPIILTGMDINTEPSIQPNQTEMVSDIADKYKDKLISIEGELNIRKKPTTDSVIVGKLYYGNIGTVISVEGDWIYISSGEVKGYVNADYVVIGEEVKDYIDEDEEPEFATPVEYEDDEEEDAEVESEEPGNNSGEMIKKPEKPVVDNTYVPEVTEEKTTEKPEETKPEETKPEQTTEETTTEKPEAEKPADNPTSVETTNRGQIYLSPDDVSLMAAIVTLESGGESYEGQLAVANVIINRLQSGYWGNTLKDVIYAPYQFDAVNSPYLQYYLTNGAYSTSVQAVNDALAGNNNIGSFMSFRATYIVDNPDDFGSHIIIGNHIFY